MWYASQLSLESNNDHNWCLWICELQPQAASLKVIDLQGLLKGYDQATNLILDECHERVYSTKACLCFMLILHLVLCAFLFAPTSLLTQPPLTGRCRETGTWTLCHQRRQHVSHLLQQHELVRLMPDVTLLRQVIRLKLIDACALQSCCRRSG